jgi:hypothetical protein
MQPSDPIKRLDEYNPLGNVFRRNIFKHILVNGTWLRSGDTSALALRKRHFRTYFQLEKFGKDYRLNRNIPANLNKIYRIKTFTTLFLTKSVGFLKICL